MRRRPQPAHLVTLVVVLAAVAACKDAPPATSAPARDAGVEVTDCDAMAARVTALRLAKVSEDARARMRSKVAKNCAEKNPSLEVRQCVVRARTLAELDSCATTVGGERFEPPPSAYDDVGADDLTLDPASDEPTESAP